MGGERFTSADNGVPGAKYKVAEPEPKACFAVFGCDKNARMKLPPSCTQDASFKYDTSKACDVLAKPFRRSDVNPNKCGFGKTTAGRFSTIETDGADQLYNLRPTWGTKGGSSFGTKKSGRFCPSKWGGKKSKSLKSVSSRRKTGKLSRQVSRRTTHKTRRGNKMLSKRRIRSRRN